MPATALADWDALRHRVDALPTLGLGVFPSPVFPVNLPGLPTFWIKEDGRCGSVYGGNKVRKLEYLLADAARRRRRRIVVCGDNESHTVLASALLGARAGFGVEAFVYRHKGGEAPSPATAALAACGARVRHTSHLAQALLLARLRGMAPGAEYVPLGCTSPLSTAGYIRAGMEFARQVEQGRVPACERLYVAFATGGTVAGLLIGLAAAGATTRVVAVSTVEPVIANARRLQRLVRRTLLRLGMSDRHVAAAWARLERIDGTRLGRGYRDVTPDAADAVRLMANQPAQLEPVFTGKALSALLADLRRDRSAQLLFWNTHDQCLATQPAGPPADDGRRT